MRNLAVSNFRINHAARSEQKWKKNTYTQRELGNISQIHEAWWLHTTDSGAQAINRIKYDKTKCDDLNEIECITLFASDRLLLLFLHRSHTQHASEMIADSLINAQYRTVLVYFAYEKSVTCLPSASKQKLLIAYRISQLTIESLSPEPNVRAFILFSSYFFMSRSSVLCVISMIFWLFKSTATSCFLRIISTVLLLELRAFARRLVCLIEITAQHSFAEWNNKYTLRLLPRCLLTLKRSFLVCLSSYLQLLVSDIINLLGLSNIRRKKIVVNDVESKDQHAYALLIGEWLTDTSPLTIYRRAMS